ncbi:hypothetical protein ACIQBJ_00280 [Kitasatospora sp. NPDC088391]|uniref:hypothetical protein n=1 Tax=Kitasatospora sp. NPDC088391 TaxID=3364074 RepID=UPI0037F7AECB
MAVSFRSDRATMTDYLIGRGLTAAQVAGLDDGPFEHGDVLEYPGLCGSHGKPPAVAVPFPTTYSAAAGVALELDGRSIREHTPRPADHLPTRPRPHRADPGRRGRGLGWPA